MSQWVNKGHLIERLTDVVRALNPISHSITNDSKCRYFETDSRNIQPGDIYVAVIGARVDGHNFVPQAFERGAVAAIISSADKVQPRDGLIQVPDTLKALSILANSHRRALETKVIALTGSVGKTTTKELLATIMGSHNQTRKSEGNRNSTIGLPMEILKLTPEDVWMIAEMGMSFPGEISNMMEMAVPDYGMLLSVRGVHMANFEDLQGIAHAKGELVTHLKPEGLLVYNADDPLVSQQAARFQGETLRYGVLEPDTDVSSIIEPFPDWQGTNFKLKDLNGKYHDLYLPMVGRFNVFNALAAITMALGVGISPFDLKHALLQARAITGRCNLHQFGDDLKLVDDTYNSNPDAVDEILRAFAPLSASHHRWIVLGDMLELGPQEEAIHAELGSKLAQYGFDRITLVGERMEHAYRAIHDAAVPGLHLEHFATTEDAINQASPKLPANSRTWLKASRGIGLEQFSQKILDANKAS